MCGKVRTLQHTQSGIVRSRNLGNQNLDPRLTDTETLGELLMTIITSDSRKLDSDVELIHSIYLMLLWSRKDKICRSNHILEIPFVTVIAQPRVVNVTSTGKW